MCVRATHEQLFGNDHANDPEAQRLLALASERRNGELLVLQRGDNHDAVVLLKGEQLIVVGWTSERMRVYLDDPFCFDETFQDTGECNLAAYNALRRLEVIRERGEGEAYLNPPGADLPRILETCPDLQVPYEIVTEGLVPGQESGEFSLWWSVYGTRPTLSVRDLFPFLEIGHVDRKVDSFVKSVDPKLLDYDDE